MTDESTARRRFQFSLRSLLIVTGLLALFLTPVAWVTRRNERLRRAHEEAMRAVLLEERYRAEQLKKGVGIAAIDRGESNSATPLTSPASLESAAEIEKLRRENAALRDAVEEIRREFRRLKDRFEVTEGEPARRSKPE